MFLGIVTLLVAISISVIAAVYSIIGLTAIFAAAFLPIVLMGTVLEIGKIITAVWLKIHWARAPRIIRTYLVTAVIVIMFITSMGIFGFLSKSHVEQSAFGSEQIAQVEVIEESLLRSKSKIERWTQSIERLNKGETISRMGTLIAREQQRITDANARIQPQVDAENARIPSLREQAQKEINQQNRRLADAQKRTATDIKIAQNSIAQLDKDVEAYTKGGVVSGVFSDTDLVAKGAELRKKQFLERDILSSDIAQAKTRELSVANSVQREIKNINNRLAENIRKVNARIADIRESISTIIENANKNINRYTVNAEGRDKSIDVKIAELEQKIATEQPIISELRENKLVFERKYRQFEAEVGPVKYIAALVYDEVDRSLLEDAVRWVIIIIVAVFDPLAICLVLAGTMTLGWYYEDKKNKPVTKADLIRVKELEMELKKHNDILDELEKILDDNLGNIDAGEYTKLKIEYDALLTQKPGLEKELLSAKEQAGVLAEQVVATEQERNNYKERADNLAKDLKRNKDLIEEMIKQITGLETEVDRRDKVVERLADKYHLIEKDPFDEDLVADAMITEEPDRIKKKIIPSEVIKPKSYEITSDLDKQAKAEFGTQFSSNAKKGDLFVRVDSLPNKLYRFNGETWTEIPKDNTTTYLTNEEYIEYLVNELTNDRIDISDLTQQEQEEVTKILKT